MGASGVFKEVPTEVTAAVKQAVRKANKVAELLGIEPFIPEDYSSEEEGGNIEEAWKGFCFTVTVMTSTKLNISTLKLYLTEPGYL
jgi:hypothetical protein